ncbi:MAG: hypothetical protein HW421_1813 [Ignavibacteria bacterium]|nr:hypothetical protein [Ignavibacteria bacterium]
MPNNYIFEIPIYRISFEKYTKKVNNWKVAQLSKYSYFNETDPKTYELYDNYLDSIKVPWKYNEVIGWICIYTLGTQYRADTYFMNNKSYSGLKVKKRIEYIGKTFELSIYPENSSEDIYELILNNLESLKKEKRFASKFIDLSAFKRIGKFINWKQLLINNNLFIK